MQPRHIVIVAVLIVAAFFVGRLSQRKPDSNERSSQPRETLVQAPRVAEPRSRPAQPVAPAAPAQPVASREEGRPEQPEEDGSAAAAAPVKEEPEPFVLDRPVTDEEIKKGIATFAQSLTSLIYGDEKGAAAAEELRDLLALATPEQMKKLIETFGDDTENMQSRVVLAHVLAQSEHPDALATLEDAVRDPEAGLMVQRFAAHGLAFSDAEGLDTFMLDMAHNHEERGVRANLSFGLQRRGVDEGVPLYFAAMDEALEQGDPSAIQYVGGLALIDERANEGIRERLGRYEGAQALLVLIHVVQRRGDMDAIPALEKLAFDASRPISVQKAAQGALEKMKKAAPEGGAQ
ncbi:MAG: hypothetical protein ACYTGU_16660 [Planctomycetota bacterium]|jgi:hypothetical protein